MSSNMSFANTTVIIIFADSVFIPLSVKSLHHISALSLLVFLRNVFSGSWWMWPSWTWTHSPWGRSRTAAPSTWRKFAWSWRSWRPSVRPSSGRGRTGRTDAPSSVTTRKIIDSPPPQKKRKKETVGFWIVLGETKQRPAKGHIDRVVICHEEILYIAVFFCHINCNLVYPNCWAVQFPRTICQKAVLSVFLPFFYCCCGFKCLFHCCEQACLNQQCFEVLTFFMSWMTRDFIFGIFLLLSLRHLLKAPMFVWRATATINIRRLHFSVCLIYAIFHVAFGALYFSSK